MIGRRCVGLEEKADIDAAGNILASGTGASAWRGVFTLVTGVTREMDPGLAPGWSSIGVPSTIRRLVVRAVCAVGVVRDEIP